MFDSKTIISSEVERAAMAGGIYPKESRFEAVVKRQLAKGLAYVATKLDPEIFKSRAANLQLPPVAMGANSAC
jgi:hypothetical protein